MSNKPDELDQIIQKIEIWSMVSLRKSLEDGDPKHHIEMINKAKAQILSWAKSKVPSEKVLEEIIHAVEVSAFMFELGSEEYETNKAHLIDNIRYEMLKNLETGN